MECLHKGTLPKHQGGEHCCLSATSQQGPKRKSRVREACYSFQIRLKQHSAHCQTQDIEARTFNLNYSENKQHSKIFFITSRLTVKPNHIYTCKSIVSFQPTVKIRLVFQIHTQNHEEKHSASRRQFLFYFVFLTCNYWEQNQRAKSRKYPVSFFDVFINPLGTTPQKQSLTLTSCLLSFPSEPTQSIIFGKFKPPAKRNCSLNDFIVTRFPYSPVGPPNKVYDNTLVFSAFKKNGYFNDNLIIKQRNEWQYAVG